VWEGGQEEKVWGLKRGSDRLTFILYSFRRRGEKWRKGRESGGGKPRLALRTYLGKEVEGERKSCSSQTRKSDVLNCKRKVEGKEWGGVA